MAEDIATTSVPPASSTEGSAPPSATARAERRKKWLALAISTVVTLFVTECGLRVAKRDRAFQPDPDLIRSLEPNNPGRTPTWETDDNLNGRSDAIPDKPGQVVNPTNNVGFRMPEDVGPKGPNEKRILLLGDSYAEAYQVNVGERFSDITDKRLRSDPATAQWRLLNGGVENGCPSQYSLQLKRWLPEFKPDIVIIALAPNDLADDLAYERWYGFEFDADGLPSAVKSRTMLWLLQKSYILRYTETATLTGSPKLHDFLFRDAEPDTPRVMWQELACQGDDHSKALFEQKTGKYLVGLKKLVEASGAELGVVMVQYLYFFENEAFYKPKAPGLPALLEKYGCYRTRGIPYQEFVESFLRREGIPYRNPYEAFAKSEREHPKRKLWNFFDYHYSPAGHEIMADALTDLAREMIGVQR